MVPRPYRVIRRRRDTVDTWTLTMEPVTGGALTHAPGQFTMLSAIGVGEVPISISGDPTREGPLVQTVRAVGHVTQAICNARRGSVLGVRGPFGTAWPVDAASGSDLVIVAGGIGLAPLRPVLYHALRHRRRYARVTLLYGSRTPADLLYRGEIDRWQRRGIDVAVTVDAASRDYRGNVGVVTALLRSAAFDAGSAVAMVCGPEVMMRFAVRALAERGVDGRRIHVSLERNMQCGVALCGHCQLGPLLLCRDGPVLAHDRVADLLDVREL
jgi:anaerobic sulfite reductase subunit B